MTNAQRRTLEAEMNLLVRQAAVTTEGVHGLKRQVRTTLTDEGEITTDVFLIVDYGVKIPAVAWDVQEHVKEILEAESGYTVSAVNIFVQGVHVPKHA